MKPILSLIQLNIERDEHFDRVIPFLLERMPDVVCVQEVCKKDVPFLEKALGMECFYVPMARQVYKGLPHVFGVAIFSKLRVSSREAKYYHGSPEHIPTFVAPNQDTVNHALAYCDVAKENLVFRIGTTHFTWAPDGEVDNLQRRDLPNLLKVLKEAGEIVFTGDFNAPRGKEVFNEIASRYKDNVPAKYTDSLDDTFHRRKDLELMVDGIFSTPSYKVSDVEMICDVSDHCALTAKVSKK